MRVLLIAPNTGNGTQDARHIGGGYQLDTVPEIRALTDMHRVSVLNGRVTAQDVYNACRRGPVDIIHFATHSDEYVVLLSNGETLDAEDIAQLARLSHARLVFFNSCRSAKLAAFAVSHGVPYAIATTVELPDKDAWKTALAFYGYLREQMMQVTDPAKVDIPASFRRAVNGDGTYMLLANIERQSDINDLMTEIQRLHADLRRVWISGSIALAAGVGAWASVVYVLMQGN